jgi:hypothetical protein
LLTMRKEMSAILIRFRRQKTKGTPEARNLRLDQRRLFIYFHYLWRSSICYYWFE